VRGLLRADAAVLVRFRYVGWLEQPDGSKGIVFDQNTNEQSPFQFEVGADGVAIPGMSKGVIGMSRNGKREIHIPPNLAYGQAGSGKFPPNAHLIFEVQLLRIERSATNQAAKAPAMPPPAAAPAPVGR